MRTLVTGGAGFIGSNLVDALLARGDAVTVLDNLTTGRRENVHPDARLLVADVTDVRELRAALEGVDVVFHLAAQVDVRKSVDDPAYDLAVNGGGTLSVLRAALAAGVRHVVYASTGGAIYGEADIVPTPEDAPLRPLAPYGHSKYTGEGYCRLFAELHALGVTSLRFANVYGPRQDPLGEGGVIAIYCGRAVDGGEAVVFGDGEQTRDFVYVGDVVQALIAASNAMPFGPFNIGTGRETTVNELARLLDLRTRREPPRPGEVVRSCLDPSHAATVLNWRAETPLDEGIARTLEWARAQGA